MSIGKLVCAAAVALALVGCERWQITGLVIHREPAVDLEEPIERAVVTLSCPTASWVAPAEGSGTPATDENRSVWSSVHTDEDGTFAIVKEQASGPAIDCWIRVSATGYADRVYEIDRVCARYRDYLPAGSPQVDAGSETGEAATSTGSGTSGKLVCQYGFLLAEMSPVEP